MVPALDASGSRSRLPSGSQSCLLSGSRSCSQTTGDVRLHSRARLPVPLQSCSSNAVLAVMVPATNLSGSRSCSRATGDERLHSRARSPTPSQSSSSGASFAVMDLVCHWRHGYRQSGCRGTELLFVTVMAWSPARVQASSLKVVSSPVEFHSL